MPSPLVESALREKRSSRPWPRRILLLTNLAPPFLIWQTRGEEPWAWIATLLLHGLLLHGLLVPHSALLGSVLTRLPTGERRVWLTIDDGPSPDTIPLSEMLAAEGVQATFFFRGHALAGDSSCLASLRRHGHTVANHTQNHPLATFWIFPPSWVAREIDDFQATALRLGAPLLPAFRCPAGVKNPFLHGVLQKRSLTLVAWSTRAYDGVRCDPAGSVSHIVAHLQPGAIVLVHEGKLDSSGAPASVAFIRQLIPAIRAAGYSFI